MSEQRRFAFSLEKATIRELLVELEKVERAREDEDCLRLRSRERMLCAELRRRRRDLAPYPVSGDDATIRAEDPLSPQH